MIDRSETLQVEIRARGEVSRESLGLIELQLGRQGLSTEVRIVNAAESDILPVPAEIPYLLNGVTNREQYVVREHLTEFKDRFAAGYTESQVRRLFGILGGSTWRKPGHSRTRPAPPPEELGLIVEFRHLVGFPKPTQPAELNSAVQVGSILDFTERVRTGQAPSIWGFSAEPRSLLDLFSRKLEDQITIATRAE